MSVLAFIPTHNDGQICPFRLLKVKQLTMSEQITGRSGYLLPRFTGGRDGGREREREEREFVTLV
jgi:hypothetical protein